MKKKFLERFFLERLADRELVVACQRGDKSAYAVLVRRHARGIFVLSMGLLSRVDEAEDAARTHEAVEMGSSFFRLSIPAFDLTHYVAFGSLATREIPIGWQGEVQWNPSPTTSMV